MKRIFTILSICFCAAQAFCQTPQEIRGLARANNSFALKLYQTLAKDNPDQNIFFSPYGISAAFSMLYAGAGSGTAGQIAETFSFSTDTQKLASIFEELQNTYSSENPPLAVANAVWVSDTFKLLDSYSGLVKKSYAAEAGSINFKDTEVSRVKINAWVSEKTGGRIGEMFSKSDFKSAPELVLADAVYFKGRWQNAFNKNLTRADKFRASSAAVVDVRMMYEKKDFSYGEKDNAQIIELPYAGGEMSMIVLLPKDAAAMAKLEENLTLEKLYGYLQNLWDKEVRVSFPKFKITSSVNLKSSLQALGVTDAFTPSADFSLMAEGKNLYITDALHKAFAAVDEEGTEAAAATGVTMNLTARREALPSSGRTGRLYSSSGTTNTAAYFLWAGCPTRLRRCDPVSAADIQ